MGEELMIRDCVH